MTQNKPKALVEVSGTSMIENLVLHLKSQGINQFLINVHHFADRLIEHIASKKNFGVQITFSDEREVLLDTGGAIQYAADFFNGNEPILIHNVDVISGINLEDLKNYHEQKAALATLGVRERNSGRALLFNEKMSLSGWTNTIQNEFKWVNKPLSNYNSFAFNGVYIVQPEFAQKLPLTGRFSIIDALLNMAKTERIIGFVDHSDYWFDLGTKEKIHEAELYLKSLK